MTKPSTPALAAFNDLDPIAKADAAHVNLFAWRLSAGPLMMSDLELACLDLALATLRQKHTRMMEEAHPISAADVPNDFEKVEAADEDGWSEWVRPVPKSYLMKCCDCGLVHEMDFGVFRQTSPADAQGNYSAETIDDPNVRAMLRARRVDEA
ncbi:hypothetical protein BAJUN_01580 [Bajunvirus bajun]|uniref:Uncharacterized protein n=1 Tax=Brevundimonas phage vB_BgoS-Bajun TaxID=2948594 RepID=A0A9E7N6S1_9CAUD|nr:hypothetical protein BAJUN_01580 [Brevundimonas phage vB_BgoS-Bajun]